MGNKNTSQNKEIYILSYTNGDKYEGEVINGVRDGFGTYFYHNGDKYEGWWHGNKKHGMGTLYYKDGNLYVGQWKNSEKEGMGTLYFRNGEKYNGEFKNGKKNGRGFLISADSNKYTGYFKDNKKHGIGVIYYSKGKKAKEDWNNGILVESNIIYDPSKNNIDNNLISKNPLDLNLINNYQYLDISFDNYIEDQINFHQDQNNTLMTGNKFKSKFFTLEVAKYFKARIPNNYFDAMQIVTMTSDLIYDSPNVTDWSEHEVSLWMERLGLEKYIEILKENAIDGYKFIKLNVNTIKKDFDIKELMDVKLILKSIDFLRIFVKLKMDYQEYLEDEKAKGETENLPLQTIFEFHGVNNTAGAMLNHVTPTKDKYEKDKIETNLNMATNTNTKISADQNEVNINHAIDDKIEIIEKDDGVIHENHDYFLTKIAISKFYSFIYLAKLLLHSLNLSGFNFFINFEELKFVNKIGEGGFGQVFLGVWNGKYVAIKKFNTKEKHNTKYSLNKFIKEINIISNLRHPNVVLYIGASINKNEYYMISEFISKGSLFDYLHVNKIKLSENEMLSIAYETAIALKYLHSRKITHCDLKSSNILLDENMKIKLSDFGLSRLKNIFSVGENKGRIGTSHWMPPEIMKAQKYEECSDVFSFGMIVWEMMSCEIPYYGLTPNQIVGLVADCKKIVEAPSEGHPALKKLVQNCLIYEQDRRPSFDHIIKYLDGVLQKAQNHDYISEEISTFIN